MCVHACKRERCVFVCVGLWPTFILKSLVCMSSTDVRGRNVHWRRGGGGWIGSGVLDVGCIIRTVRREGHGKRNWRRGSG